MNRQSRSTRIHAIVTIAGMALVVAGCGSSGTANKSKKSAARVLPVTANPIDNNSTASGLEIPSVLVENNVNPATGKDAADHLEIELKNTSANTLDGFEVYYTFTDKKSKDAESYYTKLDATFTIAPGATRIVHFDDSNAKDHYPDNQFSLYHASKNAQDVTVEVSARGVQPQSMTVKKDAGGAENPDE